jgi:hypothetical protein
VLFERCVVFGSGEVLFVSEDVEPPTRNAEIARRQVPFERGLELRREQTVTSRVADERVVDAARRRRAARRGRRPRGRLWLPCTSSLSLTAHPTRSIPHTQTLEAKRPYRPYANNSDESGDDRRLISAWRTRISLTATPSGSLLDASLVGCTQSACCSCEALRPAQMRRPNTIRRRRRNRRDHLWLDPVVLDDERRLCPAVEQNHRLLPTDRRRELLGYVHLAWPPPGGPSPSR